ADGLARNPEKPWQRRARDVFEAAPGDDKDVRNDVGHELLLDAAQHICLDIRRELLVEPLEATSTLLLVACGIHRHCLSNCPGAGQTLRHKRPQHGTEARSSGAGSTALSVNREGA